VPFVQQVIFWFLTCPLFIPQALDDAALRGRNAMEAIETLISVLTGMSFSLAIALLAEEWIFGKVLCPLFARQAVRVKSEQKR
jgi:hypothetical protein